MCKCNCVLCVCVVWPTWSPAPMSSSSRFTCTPAAICGDCSSNANNTVHVLESNPFVSLLRDLVNMWIVNENKNEFDGSMYVCVYVWVSVCVSMWFHTMTTSSNLKMNSFLLVRIAYFTIDAIQLPETKNAIAMQNDIIPITRQLSKRRLHKHWQIHSEYKHNRTEYNQFCPSKCIACVTEIL